MPSCLIGDVQITADDLDLLELLVDINGVNGTVYIHHVGLYVALKKHGYIQSNEKGWSWGTSRLKALLPNLKECLRGET